jgi:hypothetical protein
LPTAVACAECASVTPLKQDCREERPTPGPARPAGTDQRQTPSLASDPATWRRRTAAPAPPPHPWWDSVKESISSGWPTPVLLAVILHVGLLTPLISGREGPQAASSQGDRTAPTAIVTVVDGGRGAQAAVREHQELRQASAVLSDAVLSPALAPRFDIPVPYVPAPDTSARLLTHDLPEPDGIDILPKRLDPAAFETAAAALTGAHTPDVPEPDGLTSLPKRLDPAAFETAAAALAGTHAPDVPEPEGATTLPKRLDPAAFDKAATALAGTQAPDVPEPDGLTTLPKRLDPAALRKAAAALVDTFPRPIPASRQDNTVANGPASDAPRVAGSSTGGLASNAGRHGTFRDLTTISEPGPGSGATILPIDILPIPTPPPPVAAPAVKDVNRDLASAKPAAANPPQIARPAVRRVSALADDVPLEDRAYVPPPTQAQPAAAKATSPRSQHKAFQHPDRLGEVHADAPGATSPAPAGLGIRAYPASARG